MTKHDPVLADMAVRVARAEMERDAALAREKKAQDDLTQWYRTEQAISSQDPERILKVLHIIGIPARDLKDIYDIEQTWLAEGGDQSLLDWWRGRKND